MKKGLMILAVILFLIQFSSASCLLTPSLINQNPMLAVPGEEVKLLFQITGTENPECGLINLEFVDEYPFTLDSNYNNIQTIIGGTYQRDFNSFWIVPYKVRVASEALDGDHKLSLKTWINADPKLSKISDFNISVEEVRTDFIITLDSYSFATNKLVLGIANIGKKNAQSITLELSNQDNALVEGGHVKILGEIDSNEDTTASFEAALTSGPIIVKLEYNDETGERRSITKEVVFSSIAFENTRAKSSISIGSILLWLLVIGVIVYLFISKRNMARRHALKR